MNEFTQHSHISRILTNPNVLEDPQSFFELYSLPIRRFFLCLCRNADEADEQCQEFALKFMSGSFHSFDPSKGRFRDFLKSALRNQVKRNGKLAARRPGAIPDEHDVADPDQVSPFDRAICEFNAFEGEQIKHLVDKDMHANEVDGKNRYHSLLQFVLHYQRDRLQAFAESGGRSKIPVQAIVDFYREQHGEVVTPDTAKQRMHRAKSAYASKMISEIAVRQRNPTYATIRQDAEEMNVLVYVSKELERFNTTAHEDRV